MNGKTKAGSIPIESLQSVLGMLGPGDRLDVAGTNPSMTSGTLVPSVHSSAGRRKILIILTGPVPEPHRDDGFGRVILTDTSSSTAALARIRSVLRKNPRHTLAIVECSVQGPRWARSARARERFLQSLAAVLQKSKLRSVFLIPRSEWSPEFLARWKDDARFFLDLFIVGNRICAQFLTAKGVYHPDFFLPHGMRISVREFAFVHPIIPSIPSRAGASATPSAESTPEDLLARKFEALVAAAGEGIATFDLQGTHRELNKRGSEILGYSPEEIQRVPLADLITDRSRWAALRTLVLLRRRARVSFEGEVRRKSGKLIVLTATLASMGDGFFTCVFRDVTEQRKRAAAVEESEQMLRSLVEESPHAQAVFTGRSAVLMNREFAKLTALRGQKADGTVLKDLLGKANTEVLKEIMALRDSGASSGAVSREVTLKDTAGSERVFDLSARSCMYGGRRSVHLTFVDISAIRAHVQTVQDSETKYRQLVELSFDAISITEDEQFTFVNQGFLTMFGYDGREELLGKDISMVIAPENRAMVLERSALRKAGKEVPDRYEYRGLRRDGTMINVEVQVARLKSGKAFRAIASHRNITDRVSAEEDQRRRTVGMEILQRISDTIQPIVELRELMGAGMHAAMKALDLEIGAVYTIDQDGVTLAVAQQAGWSEKMVNVLGTQTLREGVTGYVAKTMEPLLLATHDYPAHLPYGSLFLAERIRSIVYIPLIARGAAVAVMMLATRKTRMLDEHDRTMFASLGTQLGSAIENASLYGLIKQSEHRYRTAVENVADIIYHAHPTGALHFISPNVERILGYAPAEFYRAPDLWRTLIHPDDRTLYAQRMSKQADAISDFHVEYRILPKGKAAYRWIRDSIHYQRSGDNQVESLTGIVSDITDRVALEDELIRSERMKTNVLDSVQEGVVVYDTSLRYLDWNHAMEETTGLARSDVLGREISKVTPQFATKDIHHALARVLAGESADLDDVPFKSQKRTEMTLLWARYAPLRDRDGTIRGVVGILTDVTARRRLEREVRESEETLRNVIDAMGDALLISDLQGRVWEVNREFSRITGYGRSDVLGMDFPYPWVLDEEMAKFVAWIAALRQQSYLRDFDMTWRRKDGHLVAISLNTTLLRNAFGEPVAMLNISRDITERKHLSTELERKNRQIELLNRIISKASTTLDFAEIFDATAREILELVQFDQMNVALLSEDEKSLINYACMSPSGLTLELGQQFPLEETVSQLALRRGHAVLIGDLREESELDQDVASLREGIRSQISIPIFLKDRILGTLNVASVQPLAFTGDELTFLQPIADQIGAIIDRIRLFQRVSDDSTYIHNLLNSINSVMYTVDRNYRITEVNKAWRDFALRQGRDDLADEGSVIGLTLDEILPSDDLRKICRDVLPKLFDRRIDYYAKEFELHANGSSMTYHLAINPMVINERVTDLVFTSTDITEVKRTEEEIRRRNRELEALNTITASISRSLDLDEVLSVASAQIKEILEADVVLFFLHDERKNLLNLRRSLGIPDDLVPMIDTLDASSSATASVVRTRSPLLIRQRAATDQRINPSGREVFARLGIQSLGAIPLQSKDKVLGALDVAFCTEHEFEEREQRFLVLIGNQLGAAIENAQLYAEVRDQVLRTTSLYQIGRGLTGTLNTQTLLGVVYDEMCKAIPMDWFAYYTVDPLLETLTAHFERGVPPQLKEGTAGAMVPGGENTPMHHLVRKGTSYRGRDWMPGTGLESFAVVPVRAKDEVIGILAIGSTAADVYEETHLRLLESIANMTEIALDKARLYEDTVTKSLEIELRNRELDDFTYVVSHDLKEPLISIEGYSKILLKDYQDSIDQDGREYLGSLVQSSARMKSLIDDLLTLSRLGRIAETLEQVSVGEVVGEILQDLQFSLRERQANVTVAGTLPQVRYNPTQLSMVFRNLISNALKFNDKPVPTIVIDCTEQEAHFRFSVTDNGIGIDPQYFDRVFMIFQRLQRSEEYRGTGAGLTIVKKIVEKHRGRIWIESAADGGTTFFFTIPKSS